MTKHNNIVNGILTAIFAVFCLSWVYPIAMVVFNSFKVESAISTNTAFKLPTAETFAGLSNFADALTSKGFLSAFWYSLVITVSSVVLILICCSMCAWFITRVNNWVSKLCYFLFVFSMVVPFQMLMFTLASLSDRLGLNTPYNICIIYLGFGAGLAVFILLVKNRVRNPNVYSRLVQRGLKEFSLRRDTGRSSSRFREVPDEDLAGSLLIPCRSTSFLRT